MGPLPSTIYWRRRVIAVCLLALVAALVLWGLNSGGGGDGKGSAVPTSSHTPLGTITAGPAPTGTHISGRPGGRDTSPADDGSTNGGSSGASSGATAGTPGAGATSGATGDTTTSGGTDAGSGSGSVAGSSTGGTSAGAEATSGGTAGSSGGGAAAPVRLPAGSSLPDCSPGSVQLSLASAHNAYSPGDVPSFQLRATNSGDITCKMDFAPAKAVFTITGGPDNTHVWASNDCPASGSYLLQVSAHSTTAYTLRWNEKTSSPKCAKPKGQQATPGTYLVQAALPGWGAKQVSFVLSTD
ncbi:hypothetical protein ACFO3J_35735 [Streptomyces polygonati]|uniref:Uncharacterized protein n=1 Tax=Streptomyces polygonati TaxID=1617087 RepID=A0ABV8I092_9ACTN